MRVFRLGHNWSDAFSDLEREVDRLLRGVNLSIQGLRFGRQYPPVNLYELDDEYLLTAELPGVRVDDRGWNADNSRLTAARWCV